MIASAFKIYDSPNNLQFFFAVLMLFNCASFCQGHAYERVWQALNQNGQRNRILSRKMHSWHYMVSGTFRFIGFHIK